MEDGYDNVYMENIYSRKIVLLERVDEEELDYLNDLKKNELEVAIEDVPMLIKELVDFLVGNDVL